MVPATSTKVQIRAAMCETLEDRDHTSVQRRIQSLNAAQDPTQDSTAEPTAGKVTVKASEQRRADMASFLATLPIDEQNDPVGRCANQSGTRCSDKGFLAMPLVDYPQLLDWTARQSVAGKRGKTPYLVPPLLRRLGLVAASWQELVGTGDCHSGWIRFSKADQINSATLKPSSFHKL